MKPYIYIFALFIALAVQVPHSTLADEPDYKQFTDIVYEWTSGGKMIQIGDSTISRIKSVWLDKGDRDDQGNPILVRAGKYNIRVGRLATPLMLKQDQNGYWVAEKLILYSGKGVEKALKLISSSTRKAYLSTEE